MSSENVVVKNAEKDKKDKGDNDRYLRIYLYELSFKNEDKHGRQCHMKT
jgi:hypothetical protein